MKLLFIHQNAPAQFHHLLAALAAEASHRIACISTRSGLALAGVGCISYAPAVAPTLTAAMLERGGAVGEICAGLARNGFTPDLVVGHPGWGETLMVKSVLPHSRLLHYCEFFPRTTGADLGFDPAVSVSQNERDAIAARSTVLRRALGSGDAGLAPTRWQRSLHPTDLQSSIDVIHDGIDTAAHAPDPGARFALPNGTLLAAGDEVVTYVARSLEPHRGFPSFMRTVPTILRRRPRAQIVVLGIDPPSYGPPPAAFPHWRAAMLAEIGPFDGSRLHFLGHLAAAQYRRLLQVSAAHVYLTMPFVLSWSMLEAMASGCLVIGSATAPVEEVIADGENGLLVDFFDAEALAARVVAALASPAGFAGLRQAARQTVIARYRLADCLRQQRALIDRLVG